MQENCIDLVGGSARLGSLWHGSEDLLLLLDIRLSRRRTDFAFFVGHLGNRLDWLRRFD